MNKKSIFPLILCAFIVSAPLISQKSYNVIEDVILLNNKPHLVRMSKQGNILSFERDLANNDDAIGRVQRKELQLDNIIIPGSWVPISDLEAQMAANNLANNTAGISENETVSDVTKSEDASGNLKTEDATAKGAESQNINYDYEFAFNHRSATLSFSSSSQLKQIASILQKDSSLKVHINSYYSESVAISKILSKNRVDAIIDILKLQGVNEDSISVQHNNEDDWANNRVKVAIY